MKFETLVIVRLCRIVLIWICVYRIFSIDFTWTFVPIQLIRFFLFFRNFSIFFRSLSFSWLSRAFAPSQNQMWSLTVHHLWLPHWLQAAQSFRVSFFYSHFAQCFIDCDRIICANIEWNSLHFSPMWLGNFYGNAAYVSAYPYAYSAYSAPYVAAAPYTAAYTAPVLL